MTKHRCLIVDDEAPAREEMRYLLSQISSVEVVGTVANAQEALVLLDNLKYDILFLDIHMAGMSGLDLARTLKDAEPTPAIVFTTAHPDHAIEAFELDVADYLLKPFDETRLAMAIERAVAQRTAEPVAPAADEEDMPLFAQRTQEAVTRLPVKRADTTVFVNVSDVYFVTAARGYTYLHLQSERLLANYTLAELEQKMPVSFARVHRSHLANLDLVTQLRPDAHGALTLVMSDDAGSRVPVARRKTAELRQRLGVSPT